MLRAVFLSLLLSVAASAADLTPEQVEFFEKHIRPVLAESCYACHSATSPQPMGALRVDTKQALLQGGNAGPAIVPGNPERSRLIQALSYAEELKMPPGGKLPDAVLERFRDWVRMGAPDPRVEAPERQAKAIGGDHWAFRAPRKSNPPEGRDASWARTPIDRFVLARLAAKGLQPSPEADKRTLLRRLSYDLVGLPPSAAEIDAFASDASPEAYEKIVERLLDSPRFGERWGRYWLDLARYSDEGFQARRFPAAWTYRDWVIDAFNEDLPYDEFVRKQLAADLLDLDDDLDERGDLAALGFLTVGINLPRPTDVPENLDDRIDVVTRGLLGLSVACARCHDHKFDPIPTRDYYSLYGVFLNSKDVIDPVAIEQRPYTELDRFYLDKLAVRRKAIDDFRRERLEFHKDEARSEAMLTRYLAAAWEGRDLSNTRLEAVARENDLNLYLLKRWSAYLDRAAAAGAPYVKLLEAGQAEQAAAELAAHSRAEPYDDPAKEALRLALWGDDAPTNIPFEDFWWVQNEGDANVVKDLKWQYNAAMSDWTDRGGVRHAMALAEARELEPAYVFVRGNQHDKGAVTPRRFLTALGGRDEQPFRSGSGRRELADAIADADNPLTARVMVNRVWQRLVGEGLVRTPSDFGARGAAPTHPDLLDYLAVTFVEDGWSVKTLIRRIVTSNVYRQASADRAEAHAVDPENELLWRMNRRRLDFEALRDSLLAVAGRLEPTVGGPPFALGAAPSTPRRSIYAYISREAPEALMRSFDFSNPEEHTAQRERTTVPQQALFLMNSGFIAEQAREAAARAADVDGLYRLILGRAPSASERTLGAAFEPGEGAASAERSDDAAAWRYGFGKFDIAAGRVATFEPFAVFVDDAWQQSSLLSDRETGRARLTASGGAPGDDCDHVVIRRWRSPIEGEVEISGALRHNLAGVGKRFGYSNGVRGWLVSDRQGVLGMWRVQGAQAETALKGLDVEKGEILDFVVDAVDDYEDDDFAWAPTITASASADGEVEVWSAADDFQGPAPHHLTPWERYAQVLLLTNEFTFVD